MVAYHLKRFQIENKGFSLKTIAILNDVHDADYVVQHRAKFNEVTLISTHAAVDDYLEFHELSCIPISSYLQSEEITQFYAEADCVNEILHALDKEFGNELNQLLGFRTPLRFFYALYRYRGRYEYTNLLKSKTAFERILSELNPNQVIFFQPRKPQDSLSFFLTRIHILELMLAQKDVLTEKLIAPISKRISLIEKETSRENKVKRFVFGGVSNLFTMIKKKIRGEISDTAPLVVKADSRCLVLINGARSAELLPDEFKRKLSGGVGLQKRMKEEKNFPPVKLLEARNEAFKSLEIEMEINLRNVFKSIVLDDICNKFDEYTLPVKNLHALALKESLVGGIWVRPPAATNGLIFLVEYLLQNNLIVLGRQHGGNYGIEVSQPKHFDSDFWWSTHYLSYGFTKEDLTETSPALQPLCDIIPAGEKVTVISNPSTRERIDILFPISNATSFYKEGGRPLIHELAEYQRELLKFLNQLSGVRVVVKPFPGYNYATSAFMELLPKLKNVEVMKTPFTQVLEHYDVGVIVSEFPSSPLFECLKTDAEILSLTNPLLPFNITADRLLKKRIYFYDSLPELKQGVTDFLEGRLSQRRTSEFAEKYLLPANSKGIKKITAKIFGMA
jgi:hypothetical protein